MPSSWQIRAATFEKVQRLCDQNGYPYPPELINHLNEAHELRKRLDERR